MPPRGQKQVNWTQQEDEIIIKNRDSMKAKELVGLLPNRTYEGIRSRIKTLQLIKKTSVLCKCDNCGKEIRKIMSDYKEHDKHFCGRSCLGDNFKGEGNPSWNNGTSEQNGYKMVRDPVSNKTKYKREHRKVMETILGRTLLESEIIHHKNGNKMDNRPENLEVMTRSEHQKLHWKQGDYVGRNQAKTN